MTASDSTSQPERRRGFRRLLPFLILAGGVGAAVLLLMSRPRPERVAAPRQAPLVSTGVLELRESPLRVEGTGTVRPTSEISLSSEVAGRVVWVSPRMVRGGAFSRGDTLLRLDGTSYRNAVAIARADVEQRRVDVALAAQNREVAQQEYELLRARTGRASGADTTLAARLARQQPQYEAAEASLSRAEAQLADANLNLRRTVVTAPFSGRVRSESVDVGQIVSAGQPVAEIYGTEAVEVDISLSTRQAALLDGLWEDSGAEGIRAVVRAEFGGVWHEWDGFVQHAAGALDPTTRTVEVVVRVPDPFEAGGGRPPLLIGSYVRAGILGRAEAHFAVPRSALRDGSQLWMVGDDNTLSAVGVTVLQEVEDTVLVRSDLVGGTRFVVGDLAVMTEGMEVRLDESASPAATAGLDDAEGREPTPSREGDAR